MYTEINLHKGGWCEGCSKWQERNVDIVAEDGMHTLICYTCIGGAWDLIGRVAEHYLGKHKRTVLTNDPQVIDSGDVMPGYNEPLGARIVWITEGDVEIPDDYFILGRDEPWGTDQIPTEGGLL